MFCCTFGRRIQHRMNGTAGVRWCAWTPPKTHISLYTNVYDSTQRWNLWLLIKCCGGHRCHFAFTPPFNNRAHCDGWNEWGWIEIGIIYWPLRHTIEFIIHSVPMTIVCYYYRHCRVHGETVRLDSGPFERDVSGACVCAVYVWKRAKILHAISVLQCVRPSASYMSMWTRYFNCAKFWIDHQNNRTCNKQFCYADWWT